MAKEIVPHKLIITLNEDGSFKDGVLQYRMKQDGVLNAIKYFTMGIYDGVKITDVNIVVAASIDHTSKGENIPFDTSKLKEK